MATKKTFEVDRTKDKKEVSKVEDKCPYCKKSAENFIYRGHDFIDGEVYFEVNCPNCGNSFKEYYSLEFSGMWGYPLKKKKKLKKLDI